MKYVKSFPLFEGNMEDAKHAESVYLHSAEGRDLDAINRHYGYRLPRTGNFFITERYSEYRIEKNTSGKWTATTTTKAKIDIGEFNTVEECFRRIWAWLIIKKGIPSGARIKEYTDWLMNPSCPVWGKNLTIQKIHEEYIKELQSSSPGLVDDVAKLFASPIWKSRFDLIGLEYGARHGHFSFYVSNYYVQATNKNAPFILLWQTFEPDLFTKRGRSNMDIKIPSFDVELSLRKEFKTKNEEGFLRIRIGDSSVEAIENKVIARYTKELAKTQIEGYGPGEHPLLRFLITVLTDDINSEDELFKTICQLFADLVEKDPKQIANIPPVYAKEVAKMTGYESDEIDAIKMSSEFGLI
jgi:hypothetical protein